MTAPPKNKIPDENRPEGLKRMQMSFASHIRNPEENAAPPGIEDRRMKIYRDLFFNNIQSLLASNFPVLRTLYDDADWQQLIREFYTEHRCQTPLFPEVAKEFLRYLQDSRHHRESDPAFLLELAHYEWVELALSLDERSLENTTTDPKSDLLTDIPVLSPLAWPLSYQFPVHLIKPGFEPDVPPDEPSHLLVYRDRSGDVKFMKLNDVSRSLLQQLKENTTATGRDLLRDLADRINHQNPDRMIESGSALLTDWFEKGIIAGARR